MNLSYLSLSDLTTEEEVALRAYKSASESNGWSHCFTMNRELRAGLTVNEMTAELAVTVRNLDKVFKRCPRLTGPMTVYRGTGSRAFLQIAEAGFRFRAHEFWSTSVIEAAIEAFIGLGGAVLELQLPVNLPGYYMETLSGAGGHEQEILLPRGILWEVLSADKEELPPLLSHKRECTHHDIGRIRLKAVKYEANRT